MPVCTEIASGRLFSVIGFCIYISTLKTIDKTGMTRYNGYIRLRRDIHRWLDQPPGKPDKPERPDQMSTAITQIEQAVSFLSGRCDGAHSLDHKGFNGRDTKFGKSLAGQIAAGRKLSAAQLQAALKMLRTYEKSQLVPAGHSLPDAATLSAELQARQTPAKAPKTGYDLIDHGAYIEVKWPYDQKDRYLPALKKTVPAQDMHFSRQTASWSIAPKHKTALSKALSAA